jgi:hypothetical protein
MVTLLTPSSLLAKGMVKAEAWSIKKTGIKAATEIIAKRMWG